MQIYTQYIQLIITWDEKTTALVSIVVVNANQGTLAAHSLS